MKTIKIFLVLVFLTGATACFSQTVDSKLLVKYDSQTLAGIKAENQDGYDFLSYFVESACYIIDMPDKPIDFIELERIDPKTGELSPNQVITEDDLDNFNPLEYNIKSELSVNSYYRAGDTGKIIVVPSHEGIQNAVENNKRISKIK